jgi:hypothetical protein
MKKLWNLRHTDLRLMNILDGGASLPVSRPGKSEVVTAASWSRRPPRYESKPVSWCIEAVANNPSARRIPNTAQETARCHFPHLLQSSLLDSSVLSGAWCSLA